jgi:dolichol-phosphate mannosyltransferase
MAIRVEAQTGDRGSSSPAQAGEEPLVLSLVIPTRNEVDNIDPLVERIEQVMPETAMEIIFVDDSDDGTPDAVRRVSASSSRPITLLHRRAGERDGGLGGAVVAGMRLARAPWVCVMDADLQHPPDVIESMAAKAFDRRSDIVVASRFRDEGSVGSFGRMRRGASRVSTAAAGVFFRGALNGVTDPMSGFFMVRRKALDLDSLHPQGFKILLEVLVRTPSLRVAEVGFTFGERHAGDSKASVREGLNYLTQLWRLRLSAFTMRVGRFGLVGLTGLVVNTALLAALAELAGMHYLVAAAIATQGSTLWNFSLTELWVFGDREHKRSGPRRMAMFFVVNNIALGLRAPLLVALTAGVGIHYAASNVISLVALFVARFALADVWIWGKAKEAAGDLARHNYDIHGLITVASDGLLPELERFRIAEQLTDPTIRVRIGGVSRKASKLPLGAASAPQNGSANGNGSLNGHVSLNGNASNGNVSNGNASNGNASNGNGNAEVEGEALKAAVAATASRITYVEGRLGIGFGADIEIQDGRIAVTASPLLKRSPHVLYTNVVEPILRWTFAERGYALVHAACMAHDGKAFLITARTDTGKTTTCLKTLDMKPYSFLSDDLVLLSPDGRALTYPKPLTVSRHTVAAVKTPLLSRRQRLKLIYQSRLHSRSGRIFAMFIARTHLPAATINAIVQLLVPPPKYQVDKLVPHVEIAPEAKVAGLMIIQRGGEGDVELEPEEALDILLSNCEDAYGFPPYAEIEHFLHSRNGSDLRADERAIIASALDGAPAKLLKSETMDWHRRVATIVDSLAGDGGNGSGGAAANGQGPRRPGRGLVRGRPAVATETTD